MSAFQVLLDSPGEPASRIQIARLGELTDPRYGDFSIDADDVADWQKNLSALPGGRALVDFEHRSERKPRDSQAAGWITGIALDGDRVMADVDWTPKGRKAITSKRYLFTSPAFGPFTNEQGVTFDNTLQSLALTNKPCITDQPTLQLAAPERVEAADSALKLLDVSQAERDRAHANGHSLPDKSYPINDVEQLHSAAVLAASHHGDWKAARKLIKRRAKELGVDVTTLPGFAGAKLDQPSKKKRRKMLDQQARSAGLVTLSAKKLKRLERAAAERDTTAKQLHQQAFDGAFGEALGRRAVTPAERDGLYKFFTLDQGACLQHLKARQPVLLDKPRSVPAIDFTGEPEHEHDAEALVRQGIHPDSVQLDQRVRATLREQGKPMSEYPKIFDQLARGEVA